MDVFDALRAENARILEVVGVLASEKARRPGVRDEALREARIRIECQHRTEEDHLYPVLLEAGWDEEAVLAARDESRRIERLVRELERAPPADFHRGAAALADAVHRRIEREERDIFPVARALLPDDDAADLADRVIRQRREMELERGLVPDFSPDWDRL